MRGRVGAVSSLFISASNELGETESGFLGALIGPIPAVIAGGVGAILVVFLWAAVVPRASACQKLRRAGTGQTATGGEQRMKAASVLDTIGNTRTSGSTACSATVPRSG